MASGRTLKSCITFDGWTTEHSSSSILCTATKTSTRPVASGAIFDTRLIGKATILADTGVTHGQHRGPSQEEFAELVEVVSSSTKRGFNIAHPTLSGLNHFARKLTGVICLLIKKS